jgi:hypothetical protein
LTGTTVYSSKGSCPSPIQKFLVVSATEPADTDGGSPENMSEKDIRSALPQRNLKKVSTLIPQMRPDVVEKIP